MDTEDSWIKWWTSRSHWYRDAVKECGEMRMYRSPDPSSAAVMADLGEEPVELPKSCTCDLRGPNMWFGCRCGFMTAEQAAKEKA